MSLVEDVDTLTDDSESVLRILVSTDNHLGEFYDFCSYSICKSMFAGPVSAMISVIL